MMFAIELSYRVALFPYPTVFVAAYSKSKSGECINVMFSTIVPILERVTNEFNAILIANEPSQVTHNLEPARLKEGVFVCSSLQFRGIEEMNKFLSTAKSGND